MADRATILPVRLLGLAWAIGIGAGMWYLWPLARGLLRGTWLNDLWLPGLVVYVVLCLWVAEAVWNRIRDRIGR